MNMNQVTSDLGVDPTPHFLYFDSSSIDGALVLDKGMNHYYGCLTYISYSLNIGKRQNSD